MTAPSVRAIVAEALARSSKSRSPIAVDIGSNDGAMLSLLSDAGLKAVGVEPASLLARESVARGFSVVGELFSSGVASELREQFGPARIVSARHTLEHAFDPLDFLDGIKILLDSQGVAMIEVPSLLRQMEGGHIESFSAHHVVAFSAATLSRALATAGLKLLELREVATDGGSLLAFVALPSGQLAQHSCSALDALLRSETEQLHDPASIERFFSQFATRTVAVRDFVSTCASQGLSLAAYGAGAKGQYLLNLFGLDFEHVPVVIDDAPELQGRFVAGTANRIVASSSDEARAADLFLITAPTHVEGILSRVSAGRSAGAVTKRQRAYLLHPTLREVHTASDTTRLDFAAFRKLAAQSHLSQHERIGFANSLREGFTDAILADVTRKLTRLEERGLKLLDIGPGVGEFGRAFIQLAEKQGHHLALVDAPEILAELPDAPYLAKFPGMFPDNAAAVQSALGTVDVVLCYSVLQHACFDVSLTAFLDACLSLLAPGGQLLIGDVPNASMRDRFFSSPAGRAFHRRNTESDTEPALSAHHPTPDGLNDTALFELLGRARERGIHAYILPQHPTLPLANRREDLLFLKP